MSSYVTSCFLIHVQGQACSFSFDLPQHIQNGGQIFKYWNCKRLKLASNVPLLFQGIMFSRPDFFPLSHPLLQLMSTLSLKWRNAHQTFYIKIPYSPDYHLSISYFARHSFTLNSYFESCASHWKDARSTAVGPC